MLSSRNQCVCVSIELLQPASTQRGVWSNIMSPLLYTLLLQLTSTRCDIINPGVCVSIELNCVTSPALPSDIDPVFFGFVHQLIPLPACMVNVCGTPYMWHSQTVCKFLDSLSLDLFQVWNGKRQNGIALEWNWTVQNLLQWNQRMCICFTV